MNRCPLFRKVCDGTPSDAINHDCGGCLGDMFDAREEDLCDDCEYEGTDECDGKDDFDCRIVRGE